MSAQGWFNCWEIIAATGTVTVIIGLFIEYGVGVFSFLKFWGKQEIPEYHVKIETPREHKGSALVVFGIAIELVGAIGIFVQSLRIDTQHRIELTRLRDEMAHVNERAAVANRKAAEASERANNAERAAALARLETEKARADNLTTMRLLGGREVTDDAKFEKLRHFHDTPVFIQVLAGRNWPKSASAAETTEIEEEDQESYWFAGSFSQLESVGWKVVKPNNKPYIEVTSANSGVVVWSRWVQHMIGVDPYSMPLDTPQGRSWAAAEALVLYLRSDLGLATTVHWQIDGGPDFKISNMPLDAVVVTVGVNNAKEDLQERREQLNEKEHEKYWCPGCPSLP